MPRFSGLLRAPTHAVRQWLRRMRACELGLYAAVAAAVLIGGSARADVSSLILLRPLGVLAFVGGLWVCRSSNLRPYRWQIGIAFGALCLVTVQLAPLPPEVWHALPGRGSVAAVDGAMAMSDRWRPLTMTPIATWNSLWSLPLPIAVLLLGAGASGDARRGLLTLWLVAGLVSGLVGYLQVIAPVREGGLYLYAVTNRSAGVGLFANRNHQAALLACLFPMLAVFASRRGRLPVRRMRLSAAVAAGIVLVPLIVVTGSRAGLILGIVGLLTVPWLYEGTIHHQLGARDSRLAANVRNYVLAGGVTLFALALLALATTRAVAVQRWFQDDPIGSAGRLPVWHVVLATLHGYFPVGSGIGSFQQVFLMNEPASLLSFTYRNQAHNDWLDLLMTGGLPALLLLAAGLVFCGLALKRAIGLAKRERHRTNERHFRLGLVILGMLMAASLVDYPLRTPSLACLLATAVLWLPLSDRDHAIPNLSE